MKLIAATFAIGVGIFVVASCDSSDPAAPTQTGTSSGGTSGTATGTSGSSAGTSGSPAGSDGGQKDATPGEDAADAGKDADASPQTQLSQKCTEYCTCMSTKCVGQPFGGTNNCGVECTAHETNDWDVSCRITHCGYGGETHCGHAVGSDPVTFCR